MTIYRITNEGDQIHYVSAENKKEALDIYMEYVCPGGYEQEWMSVSTIQISNMKEMKTENNLTCWCEELFE